MKKATLLILLLFVSSVFYAQSNGITYQAIIYNPNGEVIPGYNNANSPLANKSLCLQFSIVDATSQIEYQEKITTTTDEFGMVNLVIGSGDQTGGYATSFSTIYWSVTQKSLKVALDSNGQCSDFLEISNQPFTSVPFAFAANSAENVTGVVPIENGGTNAITVLGAKTNLGLQNVDNTRDLDKPISTATQAALNLKENQANKSTDVTLADATNVKFPTELAVKTYVINKITAANATNANLTGMVTSNGNATTVVTNANLTGVVTSTGNATAIADAALSIAKTNGLQTAIDSKVADAINDGTTTVAPSQNAVFDALALKAPIASPTFTGTPTLPTGTIGVTQTAGNNTTALATTEFVTSSVSTANATNANLTGMVTSNGNATTVVTNANLTGVVTSTGNATAIADAALSIAKTNGLQTAIDSKVADAINDGTTTVAPSQNAVFDALALKAPIASPTFTGTPTLPTGTIGVTQTAGNNTTALATTEFVTSSVSTANATNANLTGMVTSNGNATTVVTNANLTGVVTSTGNATAIADAALSIAKTNGLQTAIDSKVADAINDGTTTVAPSQNAVFDALALKAPIASPTFTGTPTLPTGTIGVTQTAGNNTTALATTEFVTSSVSTANATNANLTGMVTSNGNATTVVTNANLTGVVTSTGNATAIADAALSIAKTNGLQTAIDSKVADAINDGTTTVAPSQNAVFDALALKAPIASPTFTGTPTLPTGTIGVTQTAGNNTTALATTEFVTSSVSTANATNANLTGMVTSNGNATTVVTNANLTGVVTSTGNATAIADAALSIAKTNGLQTAIDSKVADAINDGTTTVAPSQNAVFDALALKAPIASPTFTGTPTLPTGTIGVTQTAGNNTTALATTEFVTSSVSTANATNANLTGMVTSNGNATTVVTNANLTGVVTSIGNTTSVASQTGTGSTFVMNTSPSLVTPLLGDANATSVTSPLYVSTPQALASGATISWNPANGLNAAVTLDQNSTLSFFATPAAGTYGTLVITQDATGGRTITLPSTANKILGSASTTTIALSAEPSAKDILNFYYDGINCYWNIGQGYGIAATLSTTSLTSSVTGTLPVINGGTGSATQNFVDLTNDQSIGGDKTFTGRIFGKTAFLNGGDGTFGNAFLVSNNDSGFLASYNSLGTVRTGYLGFSSGNSVILKAEETNSLILGAGNQNTLTLGANQNATFTGGAVINGQTDINGSLTANNGTFSQRITGKTAFLNGGDGTFGNAFLVSNNDSGFLASYNSLGTVRTGYLGFSSGNSVILKAEETNSLILGAGNQNTLTLGANQNATFTGNVTATSFIKAGGSVTEFLKADGSVDSNTYLTTSGTATNVSGVVALANGGTGATNPIDALNNLGASPLASPNFTGTPTAPTAATTTNNTQIATTEFVNAAIAAGANGNSVPYIGATRAVDLGNYDLKVHGLTIGTGPSNNGENTVIGNNTLTNPNTYYSTAVGANTLSNTTGQFNSAFGNRAGVDVTSGTNNTLLGYYSGRGITDGSKNTFIGSNINLGNVSNNIALSDGDGAVRLRYDGSKWNASGDMIINSVEVGTGPSNNGANSVLGNNALQNTGANNSVAIGYETLRNASSSQNVGVGFQALTSTTTGANNNAVGFQSLISNTTGYDNTGLGYASGYNNTTGFRNTYLGFLAGQGITTGKYNTIIGYTPNLPADLSNAIIIADGEGNRRAFYDNSISTWNFQGNLSINGVTVGGGNNNTIVGNGNLFSNTSGYENTTTGNLAMYNNTTGYRNTATGYQSLYNNLTGANNVSDGWHSLFNNTNGNNNSASGYDSLSNNTTGSQNTAFGMYALNGNTTGNNNTAIGFGANVNNVNYSNAMAIGANATATASNMIQLGDGAVTRLNTSGNLTLAGGVLVGAGASFNGENTVVGANALTNAGTYYSTAVGANTLSNTTGQFNSAFGNRAGVDVTSGTNNTLLGYYSGRGITDGSKNTFIGSNINLGNVSNNIALSDGDGAVRLRYDGSKWNASGDMIINSVEVGTGPSNNGANSVLGNNALQNTGANNSVAIGYETLRNASSSQNVGVGFQALTSTTTGANNNAVGFQSLISNTTGYDNTGLGYASGYNNTTGFRNTYLGFLAGQGITTGKYNTIIGYTPNLPADLSNAIIIADGEGNRRAFYDNSISTWNFQGNLSINGVTVGGGNNNTIVGNGNLFSNTSGYENTTTGNLAMYNNTTGYRNTATGYQSLYNNLTGANNVSDGWHSLFNNTNGNNNSASGYDSLSNNTTGSQNTAFGMYALNGNTTGNNNTAIGFGANVNNVNYSNAMAIGANATATASNMIQLGDGAVTRLNTSGNLTLAGGVLVGAGASFNGENTVVGANALTNAGTYYSTAVGANTLSNTTGQFNSAFGNRAGVDVTSGTNNTLLGYYSGRGITDGSKNTFIGSNINLGNVSNNIALSDGDGAVRLRYDGSKWNASGDMIINSVEVGTGPSNNGANSVLGNNALQNTSANNSVAIGYETLRNASSSQNVGVGFQALTSTTTGANNNAVGFQSLISNTTGYDNTGLGYASGYNNTTGFRNTYLGFLAGQGITTGKYNTIIGYTPNLPADLSNAIIIADGEGNRRAFYDNSISTWNFQGNLSINGVTVGGGNNNTIVGNGNLFSNTSGYENTTTGNLAMYNNTTGYRNTATGYQSLYNNLTGANNVSDGWHSLFNNTNGNNNSASGYDSLSNNTTGSQNTAFGMYALNGNTTGNNNTAIGFGANVNNVNYSNAMAIGANAVATESNMIQLGDGAVTRLNTSGNLTLAGGVLVGAGASFNGENTVVGANALTNAGTYYSTAVGTNTLSNTSGLYNSAFGNKAGIEVTSGTNNTLLGYYSGRGITDGSKNTFIGSNINLGNVSNNIALSDGDGAVRLRYDGAKWIMASNYFTFDNGIVMGADRSGNNTNTVVGYNALNYNNNLNTGANNTALGYNSLGNNTSGTLNTASGFNALANNTTGNYNTANGFGTLQANSTGNLNIAMGLYALSNNTTGSNNVAIGYAAMDNHYSGDRNTAIGNNTKISNNVENSIAIGNDASVGSNNTIQLGNGWITNVYTSGIIYANGFQSTSDKRLKTNIEPIQNSIETIMKLNPVHYDKKNSLESKDFDKKENGFIAQEIQKVLPFIVKEGTDQDKLLSVDYISIIPVLTKGIQEQQKQIEEQQKQIDKLKALVEQMLTKKN